MTCGKCHTDFFSVDRLMEHINTPCNFFLQREQALQDTRRLQPNRRNDLNQIIAGREMTCPDIREAVRAHVAKANRKAVRVSRHFNAEEQCCVCRSVVPPLGEIINQNTEDYLWAQCDDEGGDGKCSHWVHIDYCTDGSMFDPDLPYLCPCCT